MTCNPARRSLKLLTWSESFRNEDIDFYAGDFSILPDYRGSYIVFFKDKSLSAHESPELAQAAGEEHARKMLGWEL